MCSGNGHNCTLGGGATATTTGKLNDAIAYFSASSQYCEDADIGSFNDFSISFWIYPFDLSATYRPISQDDAGQRAFGVYLTTTGKLGIDIAGSGVESTDGVIEAGEWSHVLIRFTDSTKFVQFYVNDAAVGGGVTGGSSPASTANLQLARRNYTSPDGYFNGKLDEVVITDNQISTTTLALLFNSGTGDEVCTSVGCASGSTSTPSATSSPLSAADAVLWQLFFMLDALWFVMVFLAAVGVITFVFYIKKNKGETS